MADALLSALVSTILENLTSLAENLTSLALVELGVAGRLKIELENLEGTFTTIQAVLQDAEEKQWKSEAVKNWLRKLKDVAYDADDVLDQFAVAVQRRRQQNCVRSCLSLSNPLAFQMKMASKLKIIREKLDAIAKERQNFHLRERCTHMEVEESLAWRETSSLVNETEIYGRDHEKAELINMLLTSACDLSIYAICGMGGLGKTTLAQLIYNDGRVERHFDLRIWVCVSDDFNIKRLTRAIIESIDGSYCNIQELDPLQRRLKEKVSGRKLLLVLDDVWDHYHDQWNALKELLRCGAKEIAVIITTRIKTVALKMATVPIHSMGRLSDDDSWLLFQQRAFGMESRGDEYANLETIGKEIVKKCGGIPLAIKALGSLMRLKRKESEWLSIKESRIWELPDEGRMILPALRLSYDHLPPHLRQCFAFCSIFPKDYVIIKEELIELWMANGFISCKGQMDLHDMGQEIFSELLWRSFFQDVEEDKWGAVVTCKMHDLVHDLAQSVMLHECFLIEPNKEMEVPRKVRHLAVYNTSLQASTWKDHLKDQSLHSFILLNHSSDSFLPSLVEQTHLRALKISHFNAEKFANSVGKLKHLRYLSLSWSPIEVLPESIISVPNLQTLILAHCQNLYGLPKGMRHLKKLIYLDIKGCFALRHMPAKMGQLTCLRRLSLFIVGKDDGHQITELSGLNRLEGELSIKDLDKVKNSVDARNANFSLKKNLLALRLHWQLDSKAVNVLKNSDEILCGLQPHENLEKLEISGFGGSKFPNWMMDLLLPNLVQISLERCDNCTNLPDFGKLQFLKDLRFSGLDAVNNFNSEVYGNEEIAFPSLETLRFFSMSNLAEWTVAGGRDNFPCLRKLTVFDCPKLMEMPIMPTLKTLEIVRGSAALMRSVKNITSLTSLLIASLCELELLPDAVFQNHTLLESLQIDLRGVKSLSNQLDNLSALQSLCLQCCVELESLPEGVQNLTNLKSLSLIGCHEINSLPVNGLRGLSSLRSLMIQNCNKLESLSEGVGHLMALENLSLIRCPRLNSLPESIERLTSLQSLTIKCCKGLSSLPSQIDNLKSLFSLVIEECSSIMSMPEGVRSLDMLRELEIARCPSLESRCRKETGEDWPKIAHVRNIRINDQIIQSSDW